MKSRHVTFEQVLFLLALLLAVSLRLYRLGATPLSDAEAGWALQALQVAGGNAADSTTDSQPNSSIQIGPQPGYVLLTGFLFSIFGSSNFLARLLPALAGTLLILIPYLLRHQIGRATAFVLAFGLAFDPGLVTVSRQAASPMMALAFALLAVGFWYVRNPILAGIFAALALLSGPSLLAGLIPLGLAWSITRLALGKQNLESPQGKPESTIIQPESQPSSPPETHTAVHHPRIGLRDALIAAGITFLIAGTDRKSGV